MLKRIFEDLWTGFIIIVAFIVMYAFLGIEGVAVRTERFFKKIRKTL